MRFEGSSPEPLRWNSETWIYVDKWPFTVQQLPTVQLYLEVEGLTDLVPIYFIEEGTSPYGGVGLHGYLPQPDGVYDASARIWVDYGFLGQGPMKLTNWIWVTTY